MNASIDNLCEYADSVGVVLSRPKGLISHKVVTLGNGLVAEMLPSGLLIRPLLESFKGHKPRVESRAIPSNEQPAFFQRLREVMNNDKPYRPLSNNCEHFVNFVRNGVRKSPQAATAMIAGIVALMFCLGRSK